MLSVQEMEYIKSLINTYKKDGYEYYLCCTNSDSNISTDIYLYLSKEEIKAINNTTFSIKNGIQINIDTSYRYNETPSVLSIINYVSGNMAVLNDYEYIYSNCIYSYETTEGVIYPDILLSNSDSYESLNNMYLTSFLLVSIFLYLFIKSILRIRR